MLIMCGSNFEIQYNKSCKNNFWDNLLNFQSRELLSFIQNSKNFQIEIFLNILTISNYEWVLLNNKKKKS